MDLFERLSLTVIRLHTNRNKPPSGHRRSPRSPDCYLNIYSMQKGSDGSDIGQEMFLGKSKVIKNNHRPIFNETFTYVRDLTKPYTIGTDGVLRIHVYDSMPGLKTVDENMGFFDVPLGAIVEDEKNGAELSGQIEFGGSKTIIAYKVNYKIDPLGTRQEGSGVDDDFSYGSEPLIKKTSGTKAKQKNSASI